MKGYYDIVGDGGSDIQEQVGLRRAAIERSLAGVRHMIAVGSGKGGVGKSTLTLQFAAALQASGGRCAVLDADLNGPSQGRLAGLRDVPFVPGAAGVMLPRTKQGIGVVSVGALVPESEAVDFDSVSRGESYTWRATREFSALAELLVAVDWGELDWLLVDLPPGAERTFQYAEFLGDRTVFVLVTLPSELSRGVVSRSVAALQSTDNPLLGYVENMAGYWCSDCGDVRPLFPDTGAVELGIPCLGRVPFDPELAALCDRGELLPRGADSPSSTALREIAARIASELEQVA